MFGASCGAGVADVLVTVTTNTAAFVGLAVAVVVFGVSADLLSEGFDFVDASARPLAVLTGFVAFLAFADAFGACGSGVARAGLAVVAGGVASLGIVDLAIAIVVEVIAAFVGFGFDFACAGSPFSASASFGAVFAGSDAAGVCGACVARTGLGIGARAATFVDLAVAIVVEVVATGFFVGGADVPCASAPCARCASFGALAASADALGSGGAGVAGACIAIFARSAAFGIFVNLTVAVVVDAVAEFGGGLNLAFAPAPLTAATSALATFADAYVGGAFGAFIARLFFAFDAVGFDAAVFDAFFSRSAIRVGLAKGLEGVGGAFAIAAKFGAFAIAVVSALTTAAGTERKPPTERKQGHHPVNTFRPTS